MYQVYGERTCNRCHIIKAQLEKRNVDFTFKNLEDIPQEDRDLLIEGARKAKMIQLPLIIKDGVYCKFEEVS